MRIRWIDAGKGFAILLVVFGHVLLGLVRSGTYVKYNNDMRYVLELIYAFHMPVFFALSGYFFKALNNIKDFKELISKKLLALGVPYVSFSIIMFILQQIGGGDVKNQTSVEQLINIYKTPIGYLWFLYILFFIYLYIGALTIYIKNEKLLISILIFGYIIAAIANFPIYFLQMTLIWAPLFYVGNVLKHRKFKINLYTWIAAVIYLVHVPIFRMFHPRLDYVSQYNPGLWGVFSFLGIYLGFLFIPLISGRLLNILEKIGKKTIVIYLVHAPVASVIRIVLFKLGMTNIMMQIIVGTIGALSISLVVALLTTRSRLVRFIFYPKISSLS